MDVDHRLKGSHEALSVRVVVEQFRMKELQCHGMPRLGVVGSKDDAGSRLGHDGLDFVREKTVADKLCGGNARHRPAGRRDRAVNCVSGRPIGVLSLRLLIAVRNGRTRNAAGRRQRRGNWRPLGFQSQSRFAHLDAVTRLQFLLPNAFAVDRSPPAAAGVIDDDLAVSNEQSAMDA